MAENKATPTPATTGFAWCSWHKNYAWGTRLVREWDEGSGPAPRSLFACPPCRDTYGLIPIADRPL